MSCLENSLVDLLKIICPQIQNYDKLTHLRDGKVIYALLSQLSSKHFSCYEDVDLLESDRSETDQYRWIENIRLYPLLQTQLNQYLKDRMNGEYSYAINTIAMAQENNIAEVIRFLTFIFMVKHFKLQQIYMKDETQKKKLLQIIKSMSQQSQTDIVEFMQQFCQEVLIIEILTKQEPRYSDRQNQKILDRMDQLQDENYNLKNQFEVAQKENQFLINQVSSLKQLKNEKEAEMNKITLQLNNQSSFQEIEDEHLSKITQLKKLIVTLEKFNEQKDLDIQNLQSSLRQEQLGNQVLKKENEQLRSKATQVTKLEQKLDNHKDTIAQDRISHQNVVQEKEKQLLRMTNQYKISQDQAQLTENKYLDIEIDNQKLKQEIETIRQNTSEVIQGFQIQITNLNTQIERHQQEQIDTCRSSTHAQSPRNLDQEMFQGLERSMQNEAAEQLEQQEYRHAKQLQVQIERIKTMEAVNQNLKQEIQFNSNQVTMQFQCQRIDLEEQLKTISTNQRKFKCSTDDEIEQLIEAKHEESMLLASIIYELHQKNMALKSQINLTLNRKMDQNQKTTTILRTKNIT